MDLGMIAAIHRGIVSSGTTTVPSFCPSGNCSWPSTTSIAVCGQCYDFDLPQPICSDNIDKFVSFGDPLLNISYYGTQTGECNFTINTGLESGETELSLALNRQDHGIYRASRGPLFHVIPGSATRFKPFDDGRLYAARFHLAGAAYDSVIDDAVSLVSRECAL